ncbi:MAG: TolC family protein, partial [Cyclobacteriaceae bacterium]
MRFYALFFLMFGLSLVRANAQDNRYTLEECIDYALEHNQEYLNAGLETEKADQVVQETISDGLPQINANLDLTYNIKIQTSFIQDFISPTVYGILINEGVLPDAEAPTPEFFPVQFGTKYSGNASISVNQMLFDGSFFVGLQASRTYSELSRKEKTRTQIDIIANVSKAYYLALVNEEREELIIKNYQRLDTLLQETTALYE